MKLRLTKTWYETRSKAEEGCSDIAAAVSITLPTSNTLKPQVSGKKPTSKQASTGQSRRNRRAK